MNGSAGATPREDPTERVSAWPARQRAPHPLADLAATARAQANAARDGSAERKAYGTCAVALSTTRTLAAARKALAGVRPETVRDDALAYLDQLTGEDTAT